MAIQSALLPVHVLGFAKWDTVRKHIPSSFFSYKQNCNNILFAFKWKNIPFSRCWHFRKYYRFLVEIFKSDHVIIHFTLLVKLSSLPMYFRNYLHMPISLREKKQNDANSSEVSHPLEFLGVKSQIDHLLTSAGPQGRWQSIFPSTVVQTSKMKPLEVQLRCHRCLCSIPSWVSCYLTWAWNLFISVSLWLVQRRGSISVADKVMM